MKIEEIREAVGMEELLPEAAFSKEAINKFLVALISATGHLETEVGVGSLQRTGQMVVLLEIKKKNAKAVVTMDAAISMAEFLEGLPTKFPGKLQHTADFAKALRQMLRFGAS